MNLAAMNRTPYPLQRGSALLVAILMIFMLSILGVSAMRSSTLEKRMASNAVQANTAFQAAESSTEIVLNDPDNLTAAWDPADNADRQVEVTTDLQQSTGLNSDVTLQFMGDGMAPGFSAGIGDNNFMALRFQATGVATIDSVRTASTVRQGAIRIVPAP